MLIIPKVKYKSEKPHIKRWQAQSWVGHHQKGRLRQYIDKERRLEENRQERQREQIRDNETREEQYTWDKIKQETTYDKMKTQIC